MTNEQCTNVAETAWNLANEPDTDFAASVALRDCVFAIKELQSRIAELENDAERLNWMDKVGEVHICRVREGSPGGKLRWDVEYGHYGYLAKSKKGMRQAIDAAMQND